MSKPKKSKSEVECGEGGGVSTNTGGGVKETCIIHFPNVKKSDTVIFYQTMKILVSVFKSVLIFADADS